MHPHFGLQASVGILPAWPLVGRWRQKAFGPHRLFGLHRLFTCRYIKHSCNSLLIKRVDMSFSSAQGVYKIIKNLVSRPVPS